MAAIRKWDIVAGEVVIRLTVPAFDVHPDRLQRAVHALSKDLAAPFPTPTHDGSKSLGERLWEAYTGAQHPLADSPEWLELTQVEASFWDRAAVNFVSRLSGQDGEG